MVKKECVYKLSNGKVLHFEEVGRGVYVSDLQDKKSLSLFPGYRLATALQAFKAIWTTLGISWEMIDDDLQTTETS